MYLKMTTGFITWINQNQKSVLNRKTKESICVQIYLGLIKISKITHTKTM